MAIISFDTFAWSELCVVSHDIIIPISFSENKSRYYLLPLFDILLPLYVHCPHSLLDLLHLFTHILPSDWLLQDVYQLRWRGQGSHIYGNGGRLIWFSTTLHCKHCLLPQVHKAVVFLMGAVLLTLVSIFLISYWGRKLFHACKDAFCWKKHAENRVHQDVETVKVPIPMSLWEKVSFHKIFKFLLWNLFHFRLQTSDYIFRGKCHIE